MFFFCLFVFLNVNIDAERLGVFPHEEEKLADPR